MAPCLERRRSDHRRVAGWLALLAILLQALAPNLAMAAQRNGVQQIEICTVEGSKLITVDADGDPVEPFAGLPCADCLAALSLAIPAPVLMVTPAEQASPAELSVPVPPRPTPPARAPPRPPSRAPPSLFS